MEEKTKITEKFIKETLYKKLSESKNPKKLKSLDEILRKTINELTIDIDKFSNLDEEYMKELAIEIDSKLLEKVTKNETLAKVLEESQKNRSWLRRILNFFKR
ncbi:hypothetical protein [Caminibacter pacificus]|nr:hypothetical protein [Campylobacterota bacterium]